VIDVGGVDDNVGFCGFGFEEGGGVEVANDCVHGGVFGADVGGGGFGADEDGKGEVGPDYPY